jgi:hypothetical protein
VQEGDPEAQQTGRHRQDGYVADVKDQVHYWPNMMFTLSNLVITLSATDDTPLIRNLGMDSGHCGSSHDVVVWSWNCAGQ